MANKDNSRSLLPVAIITLALLGSANGNQVGLGGYWDSYLTAGGGGELQMIAYAPGDCEHLEIYFQGLPTGVCLNDDGASGDLGAGDYIYGLQVPIQAPAPSGAYLLELLCKDASPGSIPSWPLLLIPESTEPTATPTPSGQPTPTPTGTYRLPPWPEWVHRHWVWENVSTTDDTKALVQGYIDRDIPVGAVIIDAPWETCYNNFEWDEQRYPGPQELIDWMHQREIRVFIWITSMINQECEIYAYAKSRGYLLNDGKTAPWWHGDGAFLDYTNPDAVEWWHGLMDPILDMGIDGWKCDGNDPLIALLGNPTGYGGSITVPEYSAMYYGDFFHYTRERLGNDRVITSRPVDCYEGLACYNFTPREIALACWVGDQDPDWRGLQLAMRNMFKSTNYNHVNMGSDIGGFRGSGLRDKEVMIRWTQMGAFCPIMENGGGGEHRPWKYDQETLDIYRDFVNLHHSLIPYFYSQGAKAYFENYSVMQPYNWILKQYFLGESLLVAPLITAGGVTMIKFPSSDNWIDFFTEEFYRGGNQVEYNCPLERFPVFIKEGAIIPMYEDVHSTAADNPITFHVYPKAGCNSFRIYGKSDHGFMFTYSLDDNALIFEISPTNRPIRIAVHLKAYDGELNRQTLIERSLEAKNGWHYDSASRILKSPLLEPKKGLRLAIR